MTDGKDRARITVVSTTVKLELEGTKLQQPGKYFDLLP